MKKYDVIKMLKYFKKHPFATFKELSTTDNEHSTIIHKDENGKIAAYKSEVLWFVVDYDKRYILVDKG